MKRSRSCPVLWKGVSAGKARALGLDLDPLDAASLRLRAQVDMGRLPGFMSCVIKEGELVHFKAYGHADMSTAAPLSPDTLFRLYSQTKPIVVIAFLLLFERGLVKLEDPLYKYIPAFKQSVVGVKRQSLTRPILLRDLLAHTSGVGFGPGFGYEAENDYESSYVDLCQRVDNQEIQSLAKWCEEVAKIPLRFQPGKDWGYGYSSDILGRVIEVTSGQALDSFLQKEVLQKLGMTNTFFEVPNDRATDLACLYKREPWHGCSKSVRFITTDVGGSGVIEDLPKRVHHRPITDKSSLLALSSSVFLQGGPASKVLQGGGCVCSIAGGLVSSMRDYARFGQMLVNNGEVDGIQLLKPETVQMIRRDWLNDFSPEKRRQPLWVWNTPGIGFSPLGQIGVEHAGAKRNAVGSQLDTVHWGGAGGSGYMLNWPHRVVVLTYTGCVLDTATQKTMWRAAFGSLRRGRAKPAVERDADGSRGKLQAAKRRRLSRT